jgi:hypothetical protein
MIQLTPQQGIVIAIEPIDFRKGIDGIAAVCRQRLINDPFSGQLFVFRNTTGNAVKLLTYDGNGFWLCQKRFSSGKLQWWPTTPEQASAVRAIDCLVLLHKDCPTGAKLPDCWRALDRETAALGSPEVRGENSTATTCPARA